MLLLNAILEYIPNAPQVKMRTYLNYRRLGRALVKPNTPNMTHRAYE